MRIETSGNYAWPTDLWDDIGELLRESTWNGACEFIREILGIWNAPSIT